MSLCAVRVFGVCDFIRVTQRRHLCQFFHPEEEDKNLEHSRHALLKVRKNQIFCWSFVSISIERGNYFLKFKFDAGWPIILLTFLWKCRNVFSPWKSGHGKNNNKWEEACCVSIAKDFHFHKKEKPYKAIHLDGKLRRKRDK